MRNPGEFGANGAFWTPGVRKMRDFYDMVPGAPFYQKEFGFYVMNRWIAEGYLKPRDAVPDYDAYLRELFSFDEPAIATLGGLGGTAAALYPPFEEIVLEDRGVHELVQDVSGRSVLYFKGRRDGFMPEYVDHPVHTMDDFQRNILWRMDPDTPGRAALTRPQAENAAAKAARGHIVRQYLVGGYMYLRSLIGPEALLYTFYDDPALIHACMRAWLALSDKVTARHQELTALDELLFDEDICYKNGALISPDMMREFLLPYYQQYIENTRRRNPAGRRLRIHLATDGRCADVIDIYRGIGCDFMSPFEVASDCDVVEIGRRWPELLMTGGIDKRAIAAGPPAIDRFLDRVLPAMRARGGYIPTCDHGVPEEVSFENYLHYRKRMLEYAK